MGKSKEDSILYSLLRLFSANLALKKYFSTDHSPEFFISTSIQLGLFTIEFSGFVFLKGAQPYLSFFLTY